MPILLFIVAACMCGLGIMFLTGKGLNSVFDTKAVTQEQISNYKRKWNAKAIRISTGIAFIVLAVYMILAGIAILVNVYSIFYVSTIVMVVLVIFSLVFVNTAKIFRGEQVGNDKTIENETE